VRTALVLAALALCACDKAQFVPLDAGGARPVGRVLPDRTTRPDGPDVAPAVFVLVSPSLRNDGEAGWDLDRRCTDPPDDPSLDWDAECAPSNAAGRHVADLPECVDDGYGQEVAGTFSPLGSGLRDALTAAMELGTSGLLVRLSGFSGEANDPELVVDVAPVAYAVPAAGVRGDPPLWDGYDAFATFSDALDLSGDPLLRDDAAYVTRGVLVARLGDPAVITLRAPDRSLTLTLTDAVLTARVSEDLDGGLDQFRLSGRWRVERVLEQLDSVGLCDGDALRMAAEIRIADAADVRATPRGGMGSDAPCEALSVSIGFEARVGVWSAELEPPSPPPTACP